MALRELGERLGFEVLTGKALLGGSWVVISRVISRTTMVITYIRGLIAPLRTTHDPPSNWLQVGEAGLAFQESSDF